MNKNSNLFVVLAGIYFVALIVSNIVSGKMILFGDFVLTAGIFLFPIVYILDDVFPEVYGFEKTKKIIWLGFALNLFAVLFFMFALWLPYPSFWQDQQAFMTVLSFTPRLLLASFVAYLVGTHVNAWIMVKVKQMTNEKYLWLRTISSTIAGESLDSIIFMTIAFFGIVPLASLPMMIVAQTVFKILYETFATPLTYVIINYCKKYELKNQ